MPHCRMHSSAKYSFWSGSGKYGEQIAYCEKGQTAAKASSSAVAVQLISRALPYMMALFLFFFDCSSERTNISKGSNETFECQR